MLDERNDPQDALDRALSAWREGAAPHEALSAGTRDRIRAALAAPAPGRRLRSLFFPVQRVLLAGGVPLALAAGVLAVLVHLVPTPSGPVGLQAAKDGDQVVFTLANGGQAHYVYKSNVPDHFDRANAVRVQGRFSDSAEGGSDIVYYKID